MCGESYLGLVGCCRMQLIGTPQKWCLSTPIGLVCVRLCSVHACCWGAATAQRHGCGTHLGVIGVWWGSRLTASCFVLAKRTVRCTRSDLVLNAAVYVPIPRCCGGLVLSTSKPIQAAGRLGGGKEETGRGRRDQQALPPPRRHRAICAVPRPHLALHGCRGMIGVLYWCAHSENSIVMVFEGPQEVLMPQEGTARFSAGCVANCPALVRTFLDRLSSPHRCCFCSAGPWASFGVPSYENHGEPCRFPSDGVQSSSFRFNPNGPQPSSAVLPTVTKIR